MVLPQPIQNTVKQVPNQIVNQTTNVSSHPLVNSGQVTGYTTLPQTLTNAVRNIQPSMNTSNLVNASSNVQAAQPVTRDAFAAANQSKQSFAVTRNVGNPLGGQNTQSVSIKQSTPIQQATSNTSTTNYTSKAFGTPERKIIL
jgi:hypothetical protein